MAETYEVDLAPTEKDCQLDLSENEFSISVSWIRVDWRAVKGCCWGILPKPLASQSAASKFVCNLTTFPHPLPVQPPSLPALTTADAPPHWAPFSAGKSPSQSLQGSPDWIRLTSDSWVNGLGILTTTAELLHLCCIKLQSHRRDIPS